MNITSKLKAAYEGDQSAINELKQIQKGLYIVVMKPLEKVHETYNKSIKQTLKANSIILKPGRFGGKNGIWGRFHKGSGYDNVWINEAGEKCFYDFAEVHLVCDVSHTVYGYERVLEHSLISKVEHIFGGKSGQSEYFKIEKNDKVLSKRLEIIKEGINSMIEWDSQPNSPRKMTHGL